VGLDCPLGDDELGGDPALGQVAGDEVRDLLLAAGERLVVPVFETSYSTVTSNNQFCAAYVVASRSGLAKSVICLAVRK
jgi:hypothetical protein